MKKCPKCKAPVREGARFCRKCGADLTKSKKKKNRWLLPVILAGAAVIMLPVLLAAGIHFFGWFGGGNGDDAAQASNTYADEGEIILMLDECQFYVGEEGNARATLLCGEEISGEISIKDEEDTVYGSVSVEEPGAYYTDLSIDCSEEHIGRMKAVLDDNESNPVSFYIQKEVTDEQMMTLMETAQDIKEYMESSGTEEYYTEAALTSLEEWLLKDERVASAQAFGGYLLYTTKDGLAGSYGLGQYEEGMAGKASLDDAHAKEEKDEDLSETFVPSGLTMTNTTITLLDPGTADSEFCHLRTASETAFQRLADKTGGRVDIRKYARAAGAFGSGNYTDSGLVFFATHGSLMEKSDGRQMLCFQLGDLDTSYFDGLTSDMEDYMVWESWNAFHTDKDIIPENFRLIYDVSPDMDEVYTVRGTTSFISQGLSDKLFDNTIIYFVVCYAAADTELINVLDIHGASGFIGTRESFRIDYGGAVLEELTEILGGNKKTGPEDCLGLMDMKCTGELGDADALYEMYYRFAADALDTTYEDILSRRSEPDALREDNEPGYTFQDMAQALDEIMHEGGMDYICQIYLFHNNDTFYMTGGGTLSGTVTDQNAEALAGATVTLYRWLDHRFTEAGSAVTDENGAYSFDEVSYGSYVAKAAMGRSEGHQSLEFSPERSAVPSITLELTGVRGYVVDKESGEGISQASVQCTPGGADASVSSKEGGLFYVADLVPGEYTLTASKRGYEDSEEVKVTVKKGELVDLKDKLEMEKSLIPEDSWGNMYGMRGTVEYDYDDDGNVIEMRLFNDATGNLYRRITYLWQENVRTSMVYGANGIDLYNLTETYTMDEGYLAMSYGQDQFAGEMLSSVTYTGDEDCETVRYDIREYRDWSDNYWITSYNEHGPEQTVIYYRDGTRLGSMSYEYKSDTDYVMEFIDIGTYRGTYEPVFDDDGKLTEYRREGRDYAAWKFSYDSAGNLTQWTRYSAEDEIHSQETFTYDENGGLEECFYEAPVYGEYADYRFVFEDGNLIRREGIKESIGGGDIDAMEYEYYDTGVVKRLVCYDSTDPSDADLEYIYSFYEGGSLKAYVDYDYTYNTEDGSMTRHGETFRNTRILDIYSEDGTIRSSRKWIEETTQASGKLRVTLFDAEGKPADRYSEEFHAAIPSETEVKDLEELIDSE